MLKSVRFAQWQEKFPYLIDALACATLGCLLLIFFCQITPRIHSITYNTATRSGGVKNFPLYIESEDPPKNLSVEFGLTLHRQFFAKQYSLTGDDCITTLMINGVNVPEHKLGRCSLDSRRIDLGSFLSPGENVIKLAMKDTGGMQGMNVAVSSTDFLTSAIFVSMVLAFFASILFLCWPLTQTRHQKLLLLILLLGIALRIHYVYKTPPDVRQNDAEGHSEYVQWIQDHQTIPQSKDGWMFYQPPLYYAVSAVQQTTLSFLHLPLIPARTLQYLSLVLSILLLLILYAIGRVLFSDEKLQILWMSLFATFPGLILLSSKIGNDALVIFLQYLSLFLLCAFWINPTKKRWIILSFFICLSILTKSNALLLIPLSLAMLLVNKKILIKEKFSYALWLLFIVAAGSGWLFWLRINEDGIFTLVGNIGDLDLALRVSSHWTSFITFLPHQILNHPFVEPFVDESRRSMVLEYLYRTAFTGEFIFSETTKKIVQFSQGVGFIVGTMCVLGLFRMIRTRWMFLFPTIFTFALVIASHLCARYSYPFATTQDFRYSVLLLLPLFATAVYASNYKPRHKFFTHIISDVLWIFVIINTITSIAIAE